MYLCFDVVCFLFCLFCVWISGGDSDSDLSDEEKNVEEEEEEEGEEEKEEKAKKSEESAPKVVETAIENCMVLVMREEDIAVEFNVSEEEDRVSQLQLQQQQHKRQARKRQQLIQLAWDAMAERYGNIIPSIRNCSSSSGSQRIPQQQQQQHDMDVVYGSVGQSLLDKSLSLFLYFICVVVVLFST